MKIRIPLSNRFNGDDNLDQNQESPLTVSDDDEMFIPLSIASSHQANISKELNLGENVRKFSMRRSNLSPRLNLKIKKGPFINCKSPFRSTKNTEFNYVEDDNLEEENEQHNFVMRDLSKKKSSLIEQSYSRKISKMNPLEWIQEELLPKDIFPTILSFAGPKAISSLSLTSKTWKKLVLEEPVWRTLCEETYKWKEGDPTPDSWFDYYRRCPCIPLDYSNIKSLMAGISNISVLNEDKQGNNQFIQRQNFRILLHPGIYVLSEPIEINAMNSSVVTIETLQIPSICQKRLMAHKFISDFSEEATEEPHRRSMKGLSRLRMSGTNSIFRRICRSNSAQISSGNQINEPPDIPILYPPSNEPSRATLMLNTKLPNTPVIRVQRGKALIKRISVLHNSEGTDIWNGNAAIQVQPPLDSNGRPTQGHPIGVLNEVAISSFSGRGAVAIDGGQIISKKCFVTNCAATGIYIGGPGSVASVEESDIINNGFGNQTRGRGISRGHSGIYLEQGTSTLKDCNISSNCLTGISAVSQTNASLTVKECDVIGNGTLQIEMPPIGSPSWRMSNTMNNTISQDGSGKLRSGIYKKNHENNQIMSSRTNQTLSIENRETVTNVMAHTGFNTNN